MSERAIESFDRMIRLSPLDPLRISAWNGSSHAFFRLSDTRRDVRGDEIDQSTPTRIRWQPLPSTRLRRRKEEANKAIGGC